MDQTFSDIKQRVIRLVGDEVVISGSGEGSGETIPLAGAQTSAELLMDAIHAALGAVCQRYSKSSVVEFSNGIAFDLPADFIDMEGAFSVEDGLFLPEEQMIAYQTGIDSSVSNCWNLATETKLTFRTALTASQVVKVYYSAGWIDPVDDLDLIEAPHFLRTSICLYAAHYVMFLRASQAGDIGQYKTKVDAGRPTDNPLMELSNFFLRHYETEIQRVPTRQKGRKA